MTKALSKSSMNNQSGFTLIEIMAVVLLLGLALGAVSANLNRLVPSSQTESAARAIVGDLDLARSSAIANGRPYFMEIDLDDHEYRIITPFNRQGRIARNPGDREDLGIEALPNGISFAGLMMSGIPDRMNSGTHRIPFSHTGIMNDLMIYLANDQGSLYDLTIVMGALTGKTLVLKGQFEAPTVSDADF